MAKDMNRLEMVLTETKRTDRWIAKQLEKKEVTISKWCTNTNRPSLKTLFQIAECIGISA